MAAQQLRDDEYDVEDENKKVIPPSGDDENDDDDDDADDMGDESEGTGDGADSTDAVDGEGNPETDEEREAIRERRRLERQQKKEHRRLKDEQTRRELALLRNEREQLSQRLAILERKTTGSEIAQVDAAILETERVAAALKQQIQIATEANDGVAMAEATDRFYQVQRRGEDLRRLKDAAIQNTQRQPAPTQIDPSLKRNAEAWMSKNRWYNPQGNDADSRIALAIDNTLAEEGWDPRQPEFWDELTARLSKYLPHRMQKAPTPTVDSQRKPRPTTGGSGRDSSSNGGSGGQFRISPERVAAMKEAGIWDDIEARNKMINNYREFDKQNKKE